MPTTTVLRPICLILIAYICHSLELNRAGFVNGVGDVLSRNGPVANRLVIVDYWARINEEVTEEKLQALAQKHRGAYAMADPFPHMVASDIFPQDVLDAINLEVPDNPQHDGNGCMPGRLCYNNKFTENSKNAFDNMNDFGPATYATITFLQSPNFVRFLENVTGIDNILVDKELYGAGIHQTLPGGFLQVHADFNKRDFRRRRVNVFMYLNPDWKEEYDGHLELWSRDLQRCEARVSPSLGKMVIFSTTDFSYHGHPKPLTCPRDRSRRSLAVYYYTKTRPVTECRDGDCDAPMTVWQATACPDCSDEHKCYKPTA